ncbi:hypothetical protein [Novosphingopyxis sp.]|uniref:hypothetical protein n=1 Tax=Novosphingopyxis sp. TaxID=2709690 RepID=UPI003B5CB4FF
MVTASDSDAILRSASAVIPNQRARREGSIGERSKALKRNKALQKLTVGAGGAVAVAIGTIIAGLILNGIGFTGVMIAIGLILLAFVIAAVMPGLPEPTPETIQKADLKTLAGKTEIWLERQRPMLPAPAVTLIDGIGTRLDQLSPQLASLGENDPAAQEVRKLVGEYLPEMINGYKSIPEPLRRKDNGGATPEQQLIGGLKTIDREIATMTGQIARGELDKLATRGRFLELKYDGAAED